MYQRFDGGAVKPQGWLKKQLTIQAEGLSGNLDRVWGDIRDSAWIGGSREGWERVPYWLDGFIPLAYLLENTDMIGRAETYINAILDRQQADGWLCPCSPEQRATYDVWAHFLIGKVLALYCEFTGSERAERALYRSMQCLYRLMQDGAVKLFNWGRARWFECFIPLLFLKERYNEPWIGELGRLLREQGMDYNDYIADWKRPLNKWTYETHIVNICMMLKYEAVACALLGEEYSDRAERLWQELFTYNGTAVGTFTGDECLSGLANNQGTELCSVAELMYTCEELFRLTGKTVWADRLEKAAFNAFPATVSDDMWTHQYDQQVNQIACVEFPGKSIFRTNNSEAHLFGLEPHFGCCTANFNQAWPKLTMHTFLRAQNTLLCAVMLPARLDTVIDGVPVSITTETDYPFRHRCKYTIKTEEPVTFDLKIRIPGWCKALKINGQAADIEEIKTFSKCWNGTEEILVELTDRPHLTNRPLGLKACEYGPLVFALPLETQYHMREYERDGVERKFPYCDYELTSDTEWRYGFAAEDFTVEERPGDEIPFSSKNPRVVLKTRMTRVAWDYADGYETVADRAPRSDLAVGEPEEKELIPYGCAKLRMTEMPFTKTGKK